MEKFGEWIRGKIGRKLPEPASLPVIEQPPAFPKKLTVDKEPLRSGHTEIPQSRGEKRSEHITRCEHLLAQNPELSYDTLHTFINEAVHISGGKRVKGSSLTQRDMTMTHALIDPDTGMEYLFWADDWPEPGQNTRDHGDDMELSNIHIGIFRDENKAAPHLAATPLRYMERIDMGKDGSIHLMIEDMNVPGKKEQYSRLLGKSTPITAENAKSYTLRGSPGITFEREDISGAELRDVAVRLLDLIKVFPQENSTETQL